MSLIDLKSSAVPRLPCRGRGAVHARPQRLRKVSSDLLAVPLVLSFAAMRELVHVQGGQCASVRFVVASSRQSVLGSG